MALFSTELVHLFTKKGLSRGTPFKEELCKYLTLYIRLFILLAAPLVKGVE